MIRLLGSPGPFVIVFMFLMMGLLMSCASKQTELVWSKSLYQIGSQSSPRLTDLNSDGIRDIVMGAGTAEMAHTESGVVALNGLNGELLWQHEAPANVVGSAVFYDISADGTDDIVIGGRGSFLIALDGKTGEEIWRYSVQDSIHPILRLARFNFYNGCLVSDQNGDGHPELLICNGGNWNAAPAEESDRYPGVLMLFDVITGKIVAADTMPDGKETYMSPVCFEDDQGRELIVFGSGGETVSGHLYLTTMDDLVSGDISGARVLANENSHGFIAPASLADLNGDGSMDIIAISHAARITAVDGKSFELLWQQSYGDSMESSNASCLGLFNGDNTPDIVAIVDEGTWPAYHYAHSLILDGKSGELLRRDTIGCFMVSSPVAYDLTSDGIDEVIFSSNNYDCSFSYSEDEPSPPSISHQLMTLEVTSGRFQIIDEKPGFKNLFSTPWIGDLDEDKYLDIIYAMNYNPNDLQKFLGMAVNRISTSIRMKDQVLWGEYMGKEGRGHYNP